MNNITSVVIKGRQCKSCRIVFLIAVTFFAFSSITFGQNRPSGTEKPPVYEEKDKILEREQRIRKSQTIQETARVYREMVSSYKAKRIVRAEELAQQLEALLADPILPRALVNKISKKKDAFLKRVYREKSLVEIDVVVDDVSDEEMKGIHEAVSKESKPDIIHRLTRAEAEKKDSKQIVKNERQALKEKKRQERLEKKEEERVEHTAKKEMIRAERLAKEENKNDQRLKHQALEQKAEDKAEQDSVKVMRLEEIDGQVKTLLKQEEIKPTMMTRAIAIERNALDLKQEEVDRYVELYREDLLKMKTQLQEKFSAEVEALYQDGVEFLNKKAYQFAHDVFIEVEKLSPGYKETRHYLSELEQHFRLGRNERRMVTGDVSRMKQVDEALNIYQTK